MSGPSLFDDPSLDTHLRHAGAEQDFTHEDCFRGLVQRLAERAAAGQPGLTEPTGKTVDGVQSGQWDALIGRRFGDFELLELIARGGMGVVFKARQCSLNRMVAIKMIRSGELASREEIQRFQLEAEVAAGLDHPAIVPVYEAGCLEGQPFYSMGYVNGFSLARKLHHGPLGSVQSAGLLEVIASAIQYAHDRGVVHRDLKPSNVLLQTRDTSARAEFATPFVNLEGDTTECVSPKITDFGLASLMDVDSDLTTTGQLIGTPSYMAPEQVKGNVLDPKLSDIYSMGALLYAMLTGRPPFHAQSTLETLRQVVDGEPVSPSHLNRTIDRDLENICMKCLSKNPARRYQSSAELGADLRRFLDGRPVQARPLGSLQRGWRWCSRHPAFAAFLLASLLSIVSLFVLVIVSARLSVVRSRTAQLEVEADRRREELRSMHEIAAEKEKFASVQQYHASIGRVRQQTTSGGVGWRGRALRQLSEAASLGADVVDETELNNLAAACLMRTDLEPIAEIQLNEGDTAYLPAFHPSGTLVAVAALKDFFQLKVWVADVPSGNIVHRLTAPASPINGIDGIRKIAWLNQGNTLAVTTRSGSLLRWDFRQSPPSLSSVPIPYGRIDSDRFVFDAPGNQAYLVIDRRLHRWPDFDSPQVQMLDSLPLERLTISRDGRYLATDDRIYDAHQDRYLRQFVGLGRNMDFSDDGRMIVGENVFDLRLQHKLNPLVDPATGRMHEDSVTDVQFAPSGSLIVSGGHDQKFKLWDTATGRPLMQVAIEGAGEVRAVFSPDERYLAAVGGNKLKLFEIRGLELENKIALHTGVIEDYAVATSAGVLATMSRSVTDHHLVISLWELASGRLIDQWTMPGYYYRTSSIAIAPDAERLFAANHDRICAWSFDRTQLSGEPRRDGRTNPEKMSPLVGVFSGDQWFRLVNKLEIEPEPLTDLGLNWNRVDAAINWGNGLAYLFSGDEYCAIDPLTQQVQSPGIQKIAQGWPGLWENDLDAAIVHGNGYAYFFKGDQYIRVNASTPLDGTRLDGASAPKSVVGSWPGIFSDSIDAAFDYSERHDCVWFLRGTQCTKYAKRSDVQGPFPFHQVPFLHDGLAKIDAAIDLSFRRAPHYRFGSTETEIRVAKPSLLRFRHDTQSLLSVEDDLTIFERDLSSLQQEAHWSHSALGLGVGVGTVTCIATGNECTLAAAKNGSIHRFTAPTLNHSAVKQVGERIMELWMDESCRIAIWGSQEGAVGLLTLPEMRVAPCAEGHRAEITTIVGTRDGRIVLTGSNDHEVKLWTIQNQSMNHRLTLVYPGAIGKLTLINADSELLVSVMGESALRRVRLRELIDKLDSPE